MERNKVYLGNNLDTLRGFPDNSVDSIVTDPPYGLSFMGKKWDYDVPSVELWKECLRVLKPGGYLLSFAGTRTQHRMACNIEDAGFEIRDMIAWVYGSGFPKSLNIGKAVDKMLGNEREVVGENPNHRTRNNNMAEMLSLNNPIQTKGQSEWEGWGTAIKPALEPITVARKPFSGTVAENVLKWGTGGINIDGCRVEIEDSKDSIYAKNPHTNGTIGENGIYGSGVKTEYIIPQGRFPANLIHDGSDEVVGLFPDTKSTQSMSGAGGGGDKVQQLNYRENSLRGHNDSGSAARFFYCAKASKTDRNEGCDDIEQRFMNGLDKMGGEKCGMKTGSGNPRLGINSNNHPTVKPTNLMRYLIRLVTPKGGVCLDPFGGSGSTGKACVLEGFDYILCEMEEDYVEISEARIAFVSKEENKQLELF